MEARIEVEVEHLGGSGRVVIASDLEPNAQAWNEQLFETMAVAANRLLTAMLSERDRLRFEEDVAELRAVPTRDDEPSPRRETG
jgi:hypothetical protein